MSDAFSPRTEIDDSQFQGIINVYTTKRVVPLEKPLPNVGDAVTAEWGQFTGHIIIARGSSPHGDNHKTMWVQHLAAPASFAEQNAYNFTKTGGDTMSRFYVMKRADYLAAGYAGTIPVAGTADEAFPLFKFATESVSKIGSDPNSIFVALERIYILSPKVERFSDDELEAVVTRTTTVVPRNSETSSNGTGITVEVIPQSEHHDLKVTSTLSGDYSGHRQLTTIPCDASYNFPALLKSIRLVAAWAWANSQEAAPAYDDSFYYKFTRSKPIGGPYEARRLRFLTTDPDALRLKYPITKPVTIDESIGIARAWANASDRGNSAKAESYQVDIPETIHGDLTVENGETLGVGQSTNFLPATPGFGEFVGSPSLIIGCDPARTRFGLYLVEFIEINCTGVYSGVHVPFGTQITPGVELPDMGANLPDYNDTVITKPSGTVSADNATISGTTSAGAAVKAFVGSDEVGRAVASSAGTYSMALDTIYTDPTEIILRAYLDGAISASSTISTNDLSPGRPSGYLSADGSTLRGKTEPNATIGILLNASPQVETATLPLYYPQVETLTFAGTITSDDVFSVAWVSALVSATVEPYVTTTDTPADLAEKARVLFAASAVAEHWEITRSGDDLIFTARVSAADDATAEATITDPNGTGVTPATSVDTIPGESSAVAITTAGTVIVNVVSGIAALGTTSTPVWVEVGDDPSDIMAKAEAELAGTPVADHYGAAAAANSLALTATVTAANDPLLNITITAGTAEGLVPTPATSADTTPGGTIVTVTANAAGDYVHAFATALTSGDLVQVTASDAGGTSAPLVLKANATPPTLSTAVLATSQSVTGTGTIGGTVIVFDGDDDIGDAVIDGSGNYAVSLDYKVIRGESLQVVAVAAGDASIRSAPIFLTATDFNLAIPTFELTDAGYAGVAPAGATDIRIRRVADNVETTATLHANSNFTFSLAGEAAGAAFDVYARYAAGDSDAVRIFVPTIPKADPQFRVWLGPVKDTWTPGSALDTTLGFTVDLPWCYKMVAFFQVWVEGMTVTVSFPGSDQDDIVIPDCPADADIYDIAAVDYSPLSYPNGMPPKFARVYLNIPLDTSGPVPMPYGSVKVTLSYPDGDEVSAVFNTSTFQDSFGQFIKGRWNYAYFSSDYQKGVWEEYYAAGY